MYFRSDCAAVHVEDGLGGTLGRRQGSQLRGCGRSSGRGSKLGLEKEGMD